MRWYAVWLKENLTWLEMGLCDEVEWWGWLSDEVAWSGWLSDGLAYSRPRWGHQMKQYCSKRETWTGTSMISELYEKTLPLYGQEQAHFKYNFGWGLCCIRQMRFFDWRPYIGIFRNRYLVTCNIIMHFFVFRDRHLRFFLNFSCLFWITDRSPTFKYVIFSRDGKWLKYLLRGDAKGTIAIWRWVPYWDLILHLTSERCYVTY